MNIENSLYVHKRHIMEKKDFYRLHAEFCKSISNPKRQEILEAIREREKTVNELIVGRDRRIPPSQKIINKK